ncbi:hypothetical protein CAPTEDRAFT_227688 [Capitella teleta]|uniref:Dickkopf N-terminal cysteine-rich domain-containing protein n=1 Tax=Capitella teleta TaxID=283909 RepID=R7UQI6_CAPTE|nr:hypothetical protein CAPTEDRAFT_227688 [Capitella teleta]|eukprot:ELU08373.1 hypothetical protein CAPTEDRAFT_227688 [Capitella teleta]
MRAIGLLMGCLLLLAAMQSSYVVVQARSGRKVENHNHHGHQNHKDHRPSGGDAQSNRSQHNKGSQHQDEMDIHHDFQATLSPEISQHLKTPNNEYMIPTQTGKQHHDPFQVHISIERIHPKKDKPKTDAHRQQEIHKESAVRDRKRGNHHQQCAEDTDCPKGECCLQIWTGEKVCKRGGYKMANHHCINSCICSLGLECVYHRHNHARETDRHTLGRCQPKSHHHHHHKKSSDLVT